MFSYGEFKAEDQVTLLTVVAALFCTYRLVFTRAPSWHLTPERYENGVFPLKTHQMRHSPVGHFGLIYEGGLPGQGNPMIIIVSPFWKAPFSNVFGLQ